MFIQKYGYYMYGKKLEIYKAHTQLCYIYEIKLEIYKAHTQLSYMYEIKLEIYIDSFAICRI